MAIWRRLEGEIIRKPIFAEIESVLEKEKEYRLKACIGTDSQVHGKIIRFATAIVFLREKKGGFVFLKTFKSEREFSLKERMLFEVSESIGIAYEICPLLDKFGIGLEVHADINSDPEFESHIAYKEAMGYILGMGYTFRAKPNAFASTYCANKVIK